MKTYAGAAKTTKTTTTKTTMTKTKTNQIDIYVGRLESSLEASILTQL